MVVSGYRPAALLSALLLLMAAVVTGTAVPSIVIGDRGDAHVCHAGAQAPDRAPPTHDQDCNLCSLCSVLSSASLMPTAPNALPMPRIGALEPVTHPSRDFVPAPRRFAQPRAPPARA